MIEFAILCVLWLAFCVFVGRKGTAHFVHPAAGIVLPLLGGIAAAVLEALPFTPISAGFTLRTIIAVFGGVMAGRLFGRITAIWARAHEKRAEAQAAAGNTAIARTPRLAHPLIAAGMLVAGLPAIFHLLTSNHVLIEELTTPRDPKTRIVHGCEQIRLDGTSKRAVLLLHDLNDSPADFGDLPKRLHAAGLTVRAPLLPGHGLLPDAPEAVWADDYLKAARAAYRELAPDHDRIACVGFGFGGTLALLAAADGPPDTIVLVNPYLGHLVTPRWSPLSFDASLSPASRIIRRVPLGADLRGVGYCTQSLHAVRQMQTLSGRLPAGKIALPGTPLFLLSGQDRAYPGDATRQWIDAHVGADLNITTYGNSGHRLYLEPDAEAALDLTVRWITAEGPR